MFFNIVHNLQSLGQEVATHTMVLKILQSLLGRWEAKWAAIKETKNLCTLIVEGLMGSLQSYE